MCSGLIGAGLSAFVAKLPAGALIVIVAALVFMFSLLCGSERGLIPRYIARRQNWIPDHRPATFVTSHV